MLDAPNPNGGGRQPDPKPARALPDFAVCRASRSGVGDLIYCLVPSCQGCQYVERHAFNNFCFHPDWKKIINRTEAEEPE